MFLSTQLQERALFLTDLQFTETHFRNDFIVSDFKDFSLGLVVLPTVHDEPNILTIVRFRKFNKA